MSDGGQPELLLPYQRPESNELSGGEQFIIMTSYTLCNGLARLFSFV
jgi:hypothetical protein